MVFERTFGGAAGFGGRSASPRCRFHRKHRRFFNDFANIRQAIRKYEFRAPGDPLLSKSLKLHTLISEDIAALDLRYVQGIEEMLLRSGFTTPGMRRIDAVLGLPEFRPAIERALIALFRGSEVFVTPGGLRFEPNLEPAWQVVYAPLINYVRSVKHAAKEDEVFHSAEILHGCLQIVNQIERQAWMILRSGPEHGFPNEDMRKFWEKAGVEETIQEQRSLYTDKAGEWVRQEFFPTWFRSRVPSSLNHARGDNTI